MRCAGLLAAGLSLASSAAAILVAPNSPCDPQCGNVLTATTPADIECNQDDYVSDAGLTFQQCITCEITSGFKTSSNSTDVQWLLYNLRYALSYCLFGVPQNKDIVNSPCLTSFACGNYQKAITYKNLAVDADEFGYCSLWPTSDFTDFDGCRECFQSGDQTYLANFFTILQAGCEQKPAAGVMLGLQGTPFSTVPLNITAPTPTATVNPEWFNPGPFDLAAKVGIVVGGLIVILFFLGCCIIWNGKRRRRAFLRSLETRPGYKSWPSRRKTREMNETPVSARPFRNWDDSPQSARSEQFGRFFPPQSKYGSPVSATDTLTNPWNAAGQYTPQPENALNIGMAFGGDAGGPGHGNGTADQYEMQKLQSPYGDEVQWQQGHAAPPGQGYSHVVGAQFQGGQYHDLTEEQLRGRRAF